MVTEEGQGTVPPAEPAQPITVSTWGPPEKRRPRPVGMGDVVLGFVYSQLFGTIPFLIALIYSLTQIASISDQVEANSVVQALQSSGPVVIGSLLATWAGFMLATWWAALRKGDKDWRKLLKWSFKPVDLLIAVGFVVILRGLEMLVALLLEFLGVDTSKLDNSGVVTSQQGVWLIAIAVLASVGAPIVEELFFRGLFLSVAVRNYGKPIGIILVSIVFGLMHAQPTLAATLYTVTSTAIIGACLALLVLKTNRLGTGIASHIAFNSSAVIITLIASGMN